MCYFMRVKKVVWCARQAEFLIFFINFFKLKLDIPNDFSITFRSRYKVFSSWPLLSHEYECQCLGDLASLIKDSLSMAWQITQKVVFIYLFILSFNVFVILLRHLIQIVNNHTPTVWIIGRVYQSRDELSKNKNL
jgi:hypothetical protein